MPDIDDTDGVDPQGEFEAWRLRELARIKRDKEDGAVVKEVMDTARDIHSNKGHEGVGIPPNSDCMAVGPPAQAGCTTNGRITAK